MITDPNKLIDTLDKLPNKIRLQKLIVIKADNEVEEKKLKYNVAFGMALIAADKPNATEKKAKATIETEKEAEDLLASQYNCKKEESALKYLEDRFVSLRKISSIEIELIKTNISGT